MMRNLVDQRDIATQALENNPIDAGPVLRDQVSERIEGRRMEWCLCQVHQGGDNA